MEFGQRFRQESRLDFLIKASQLEVYKTQGPAEVHEDFEPVKLWALYPKKDEFHKNIPTFLQLD